MNNPNKPSQEVVNSVLNWMEKQDKPNIETMFKYYIRDNFKRTIREATRKEAIQAMKDSNTHVYTDGLEFIVLKFLAEMSISQIINRSRIFK